LPQKSPITRDQQDILNAFAVAVTIVDPVGIILFYNEYASRILDRRPEHLGRDVRECHKRLESVQKIDSMLLEFRQGRKEPFSYISMRNGSKLLVSFSPFVVAGELIGVLQIAAQIP
jgi:DUF438 domain-containing protein